MVCKSAWSINSFSSSLFCRPIRVLGAVGEHGDSRFFSVSTFSLPPSFIPGIDNKKNDLSDEIQPESMKGLFIPEEISGICLLSIVSEESLSPFAITLLSVELDGSSADISTWSLSSTNCSVIFWRKLSECHRLIRPQLILWNANLGLVSSYIGCKLLKGMLTSKHIL